MNVQPEFGFGNAAARSVAIVGAAGHVGGKVIERLVGDRRAVETILAVDIREVPADQQQEGVIYEVLDVRSAELSERFREHRVECVVHLASVTNPPKGMSVHDQYSISVDGTHNVVDACLTADVLQLIVLSGAAAYGYHPDNPVPLLETSSLRGNDEFAYSKHKRLVEESLARVRAAHPELIQLVLRPSAILGEGTSNQLTELFVRPVMIGVLGTASPFVFVLDDDVAACIVKGIHERRAGVFNVAADGVVTARDIARRTGARLYEIPGDLLRVGLSILRACRLTHYGPEQVAFLQYRPVLSNAALKRDFDFTPTMSSLEVFELWWKSWQSRQPT
jgi:UDP-glucose 4-epimerase